MDFNPFLYYNFIVFSYTRTLPEKESKHCYVLSAGCRAGTFGPNCNSRCSCLNGGRCDFRSGACYCPPGFIGADCSSSGSSHLLVVHRTKLFSQSVSKLLVNSSSLCFLYGKVWSAPAEATFEAYDRVIFIFFGVNEDFLYVCRLSERILWEGLC